MGRNHKRVIMETLEVAKELNLPLQFNNYVNGEFVKDYATSVIIDNKSLQAINGLQSWDNKDFRLYFMMYLREYKEGNMSIADIEHAMKGSKTSSTRNEHGHVEYAKDSYRWSKIDLLDKWHEYAEKSMDADYDNALDIPLEDYKNNLRMFLVNALKKCIACNPNMNNWSAERLEGVYITHCILPKFIKNELGVELNNEELHEVKKTYLMNNPELFNDCLHRLANDTMVKDDLFYRMGLV